MAYGVSTSVFLAAHNQDMSALPAMQICLTGGIQEDNCALGSQSCWHNDSLSVSACIDTYRGYKCKCPEGASHFTKPFKFVQLMLVMRAFPQCLPCIEQNHCGRDCSCSKACGYCCKGVCRAPVQCPNVAPAPTDPNGSLAIPLANSCQHVP